MHFSDYIISKMFEVILATDMRRGIGKNNRLPWKYQEELRLFKRKTMGHVLIVGKTTYKSLPSLKGRTVLYLSRTENHENSFNSLDKALEFAKNKYPQKKVFIAGGASLYNQVFKEPDQIEKLHWSIVNGVYDCDTHVDDLIMKGWKVKDEKMYKNFMHTVYTRAAT